MLDLLEGAVIPMLRAKGTILVVDDEPTVLTVIQTVLSGAGFAVETMTSALDALERVQQGGVGVLLVDAVMPGMDGISLVHQIEALNLNIPAVFLTGNPHLVTQAGLQCPIIEKPFDNQLLLDTVRRLMRDVYFDGRLAGVELGMADVGGKMDRLTATMTIYTQTTGERLGIVETRVGAIEKVTGYLSPLVAPVVRWVLASLLAALLAIVGYTWNGVEGRLYAVEKVGAQLPSTQVQVQNVEKGVQEIKVEQKELRTDVKTLLQRVLPLQPEKAVAGGTGPRRHP